MPLSLDRKLRSALYRVHRFYKKLATPVSLGCRALVVRGDHVLLVQHSYQQGWYLPGGTVERGESLREAVIRELSEECSLAASDAELHGMYYSEFEGRSDHVALYVVRAFQELTEKRQDAEISAVGFYPLTDLPEGTTPATRRRVAEFVAGAPAPERW